jgi:hypothetical protein
MTFKQIFIRKSGSLHNHKETEENYDIKLRFVADRFKMPHCKTLCQEAYRAVMNKRSLSRWVLSVAC